MVSDPREEKIKVQLSYLRAQHKAEKVGDGTC